MVDEGCGFVPKLPPACEVFRGKKPLRVMPVFRIEPAALFVAVASRREALVEDHAPIGGAEFALDIALIHVGFNLGKPIVRDPHRPARKAGPFGMRGECLQAPVQNVGFRPAMRFGKKQILAARPRGAGRQQIDVMIRVEIFEAILGAQQCCQLLLRIDRKIRRHDENGLEAGSGQGLRLPAAEASLPAVAMVLERNDDGENQLGTHGQGRTRL